jgi:hypothetical protein
MSKWMTPNLTSNFKGLNAQTFVEGDIKVFNLMCRFVEEQHCANNIQKWIDEGLQEFGITYEQLLSFTIDSARNLTKAVDDFIAGNEENEKNGIDDYTVEQQLTDDNFTEFSRELSEDSITDVSLPAVRIHCAVHKLQLGVNDFLKSDSNSRIINIAQKLSAKLRTPNARILLNKECLRAPKMFQVTR